MSYETSFFLYNLTKVAKYRVVYELSLVKLFFSAMRVLVLLALIGLVGMELSWGG